MPPTDASNGRDAEARPGLNERGELLRIGRVRRAHGLTGELEVRLDWEESAGLLEASHVYLELADGRRQQREVLRARATPKGVLLSLQGIADRTSAESCVGNVVCVPRGELPELEPGEYYLSDLVGASVTSRDGFSGRVVEVQMYPSVDALVLESSKGERFEQPLLDEWIERVDVAAREIVLRSRDGLIGAPGRCESVDTAEDEA
jgi:16S rRNA processing protein RimM